MKVIAGQIILEVRFRLLGAFGKQVEGEGLGRRGIGRLSSWFSIDPGFPSSSQGAITEYFQLYDSETSEHMYVHPNVKIQNIKL